MFSNIYMFTFSEIPIFIQFGDLDRYLLNGFSQNKAVRTNFEGIHLENYLTKHRYFNGLVDMFKDKIVSTNLTDMYCLCCYRHVH